MNRLARSAASLFALTAAGLTLAGPIDPAIGPVTGTMKTLTEVEPRTAINATNTPGNPSSLFVISQPGSYYLTANVTGVSGKIGISITAPNVTIDLNGFTVRGATGSLSGISTAVSGLTVKNGTVSGWGSSGVVTGTDGRVTGLTCRENIGAGIVVGSGGTVDSCVVSGCGGDGIYAGDNSIVRNSTSSLNTQNGIRTLGSSRIEHCVANGNTLNGVYVGNFSTVLQCTAADNTAAGIVAADQSSVTDCTASSNGTDGIAASFGVHVARCTLYVNTNNGISCGSACRIEDNHCRFNGSSAAVGAGILVEPNTSRTIVKNNTVVNCDYGIKVDSINNLVIGNSTSSNTVNYEIIAGNRVGLIITLPTSAAISGNTGGTTITSPDANYVY